MGKLFEEFKTMSAQRIQPNKLDELKAKMPEDEYKDLIDAISDTSISSVVISRVLKTKGYEISGNTILNWRHKLNDRR